MLSCIMTWSCSKLSCFKRPWNCSSLKDFAPSMWKSVRRACYCRDNAKYRLLPKHLFQRKEQHGVKKAHIVLINFYKIMSFRVSGTPPPRNSLPPPPVKGQGVRVRVRLGLGLGSWGWGFRGVFFLEPSFSYHMQ